MAADIYSYKNKTNGRQIMTNSRQIQDKIKENIKEIFRLNVVQTKFIEETQFKSI